MFKTPNLKFENFKLKKFKKKISKIDSSYLNSFKILDTLKPKFNYSFNSKDIKRIKKNKIFRVIGMGGSSLGVEAIYQFINHKVKKKFLFVNNLQNKYKNSKINSKCINIIISKSGDTLETIINSNILINKNKKNNIFIVEDNKNYLRSLASKLESEIYDHKNFIGGRYSVLSEVGMLPAELMGLNKEKFKRYNFLFKNKNFLNSLIENVNQTLSLINYKKYNSIILNYDEGSENLFKWYQQLLAESLGKKSKGILPFISSMPKDNHSMLQLYLDGPKNNFFTFFNLNYKDSIKIKNNLILNSKNYLKNKSIAQVLNYQKIATQNIFRKKNIPFRSIEIYNKSEETLGELFCFFILETIMLGRALNVNPFDQPSVELVKKETKKLLINSKK